MHGEIVVREANASDWEMRAELVRRSITDYDFDAFILLFFQELTLQVCVLCGAVMFIFVGAGPWACAGVVPAAAALLALAVRAAHRARADAHAQRLRAELRGFVAEYRGPLVPALAGAGRLVGTVSVAELWGPRRGGWLTALCVARGVRRRGAGAALLAAARQFAVAEGLEVLEARATELQGAVRCLLHNAGWEISGSYARPLLGAALSLHVTQLVLELPHA